MDPAAGDGTGAEAAGAGGGPGGAGRESAAAASAAAAIRLSNSGGRGDSGATATAGVVRAEAVAGTVIRSSGCVTLAAIGSEASEDAAAPCPNNAASAGRTPGLNAYPFPLPRLLVEARPRPFRPAGNA